ncbi:hypothetical protein Trydic_g17356 [Trypoxylus dichotomus]
MQRSACALHASGSYASHGVALWPALTPPPPQLKSPEFFPAASGTIISVDKTWRFSAVLAYPDASDRRENGIDFRCIPEARAGFWSGGRSVEHAGDVQDQGQYRAFVRDASVVSVSGF